MREKAISPLRQRMIEDMRSVRKSDDQSGSRYADALEVGIHLGYFLRNGPPAMDFQSGIILPTSLFSPSSARAAWRLATRCPRTSSIASSPRPAAWQATEAAATNTPGLDFIHTADDGLPARI